MLLAMSVSSRAISGGPALRARDQHPSAYLAGVYLDFGAPVGVSASEGAARPASFIWAAAGWTFFIRLKLDCHILKCDLQLTMARGWLVALLLPFLFPHSCLLLQKAGDNHAHLGQAGD